MQLTLQLFTESAVCASGKACKNCRSSRADEWYKEWSKNFAIPEDWEARPGESKEETDQRRQAGCPKNLPMGWTPPREGRRKRGAAFKEWARERRTAAEERAKTLTETWRLEGPKLWAAFVDWALNSKADADGGWTERRRQFNRLVGSVPCGGCRADFVAMIERTPPPFSHPDNARRLAWVYARHDEVNFKLGRPAFWAIVKS